MKKESVLTALKTVAYAIVAGVVAFFVYYAVSLLIYPLDVLTRSTYTGVSVAVFVGVFSALVAYRRSETE
jgi:hypothetical protein